MHIGHRLQIHCRHCEEPILFSVLDSEAFAGGVQCTACGKRYAFTGDLVRQLKQFEALCRQIHASEEILGGTSIAIDVGKHHVMVPFNILLTRLSSVIELDVAGEKVRISFRVEPLKDVEETLSPTSAT